MACYQPLPARSTAFTLWQRLRDLRAALRVGFSRLVDWLGRSFVERYLERKRVYELRSLSDRTLKDIGIHRSEVLSVVHGKRFSPEERRYEEG